MSVKLQEFEQSKQPVTSANIESNDTNLAMNIIRSIKLDADNSEILEILDGYYFKIL